MIRTIPLDKLVTSTRNVRRSSDEQADFQLKADIEARGLLQNLVVTRVARPRGSFAVVAGGRRLRALLRLAEEGRIAPAHEVPCLVLDRGSAPEEASLAENFQRLAMNPADECTAFRQLLEEGAEVEGVARRFGVTTRFVEGRLRLAGLAPVIFEALGAGEISLDAAKAYAATADLERQVLVFEQLSRGYGSAHPDSIRRMMTQASVCASDRRARFVGEAAYVAAGGRIEQDLFAAEEESRWLDIAILERLATEKMEAAAALAAAESGLGFVRPTLERWIGGARTDGLRRLPAEPAPLTGEEAAHAEALQRSIDETAETLLDEAIAHSERTKLEARLRELGDQLEAITDRPPAIDEALRPRAGAFLLLDELGRPKLDSARYIDLQDEVEAADPEDKESGAGDGSASEPQPAACLSQRLLDELAMQRRDILAVHIAADPGLALDLAIFLMIDRETGYPCERPGSTLSARPATDPVDGFTTPDAPATIAGAEAAQALDRSWTEGTTCGERFDRFRALGEEARAAWLGHAVARTLEASLLVPAERARAFHDHLGTLLTIDVAGWWRPNGANFFDRVPKSVSLAALEEIGGPALAARYAQARKAELAQACERIFAGDFIAEVDVKEAALAWLPQAMRFSRIGGDKESESDPAGPDLAAGSGVEGSGAGGGTEVGAAA